MRRRMLLLLLLLVVLLLVLLLLVTLAAAGLVPAATKLIQLWWRSVSRSYIHCSAVMSRSSRDCICRRVAPSQRAKRSFLTATASAASAAAAADKWAQARYEWKLFMAKFEPFICFVFSWQSSNRLFVLFAIPGVLARVMLRLMPVLQSNLPKCRFIITIVTGSTTTR